MFDRKRSDDTLPFDEFPRFGTVSFVEEAKVVIEEDSTKETCTTLYDNNDNEKEYLFEKPSRRTSRPRSTSVFHMTDSKFAGGIVNRCNYMTRCFKTAWEINTADIPCLKLLLWNGESSKSPTWQSVVVLTLQWVFPFLPIFLLPGSAYDSDTRLKLSWVFLVFEFIALVWHAYVLYIIISNRRNWKQAWFTFEVPRGTIGLVDSGVSDELTVFHFSANIRFIKTTYSTISKLHTISEHQQGVLREDMRQRNLEKCEVILFTEDFTVCYNRWPKYMTLGLLLCQCASVILLFGIISHP